jgi:hypothetical protein
MIIVMPIVMYFIGDKILVIDFLKIFLISTVFLYPLIYSVIIMDITIGISSKKGFKYSFLDSIFIYLFNLHAGGFCRKFV